MIGTITLKIFTDIIHNQKENTDITKSHRLMLQRSV